MKLNCNVSFHAFNSNSFQLELFLFIRQFRIIMHQANYAKELYNLVINMRIQWNGHLGSRLDLGQGEADDRGGTPNVPTVMDAIYHIFLLETMNRGQYL